MRDSTLCYVFDRGKVLLQKKARGFGEGKWNAPGGKMKNMETPEMTAIREVWEETGLAIQHMDHRGLLMFKDEKGKRFTVHVYVSERFSGTPKDSQEGELKWFDKNSLPFEEMWEDDAKWLPHLFEGKRVEGQFMFTEGFKRMIDHQVVTV